MTFFAYCVVHLQLDVVSDKYVSDFAICEEMRSFGRLSSGCYAVPTGKQVPIFQMNLLLSKRPLLSVDIAYLVNYVTYVILL
jgi:hypothetical protein